MKKSIKNSLIGEFTYNEGNKSYEANERNIHWKIDICNIFDVDDLIKAAEKLFLCLDEFNSKAKVAIAENMIEYKNDFWPEYDENDKTLNWDAVDEGEFDITIEEFRDAIILYDIEISENEIYCEYNDGDLFGGHRIHAYFNSCYELLRVNI
ncbi:DUF2262 domain-containing protein [Metabacillus litoralis]|uniref:DUF2262 domain-containing protein n=1 Tax=Metabacillus litoralis TaxID=152268 RepID=UPI001CFC4DC5|nr:DUF2262 domain-containing protein [Metabacillus litoralis]